MLISMTGQGGQLTQSMSKRENPLTWGCKEGTEKWNGTGNVEEEGKEEAQRCDDYIRRDENFYR